MGTHQRGKSVRDIVQRRVLRFFRPLAGFDLLPARQHLAAVAGGSIGKNVRMAAFKLVADGRADVVKVKTPLLLRHLGVEHHLEQQIPQLTA